MKCLPHAKVKTAKGNILHDSHAEVLAIRGFNRWLVDECAELARKGFWEEGQWVRWRRADAQREDHLNEGTGQDKGRGDGAGRVDDPPFELHPDVRLHMYCSDAPCGDASMELVMREQADATPWTRPSPTLPTVLDSAESDIPSAADEQPSLLGRGFFDQLGVVRRKPARPDAPPTLSKSCSDKLALKQCTGLLSALTSQLVAASGTWLSSLVLPEDRVVDSAVKRAFGGSGRLAPLAGEERQARWREEGYEFRPFEVLRTSRLFEHARDSTFEGDGGGLPVPSNLSTLVTPHKQEILINGVMQGRKQDDRKGASCVSRRRMWEAVRDVHGTLGLEQQVQGLTYGDMKADGGLSEAARRVVVARESVKRDAKALALQGWTQNDGDAEWTLDGS